MRQVKLAGCATVFWTSTWFFWFSFSRLFWPLVFSLLVDFNLGRGCGSPLSVCHVIVTYFLSTFKVFSENTLQKHMKNFARKTGIEKTLAVRQGIKGILYSKTRIAVEFIYSRPPDGKSLSDQSDSAAALRAAPAFLPPADFFSDQQKRPDPVKDQAFLMGVGPHQMVEYSSAWFTLGVPFPNITHNFWDHYRLTGQFNVRSVKL